MADATAIPRDIPNDPVGRLNPSEGPELDASPSPTDVQSRKKRVQAAVDARDAVLRDLALRIHDNPELSFAEHRAAAWLTQPLGEAGFQVEMGLAGLPTAFRATWQGAPGGPAIALLAEYDALPGLGHACGHNLIGPASVGAALALKDAVPDLPGRILVIGCPAEEKGGGKILLADAGVFDGLDAAIMCHPARYTMVLRGSLARVGATFKFYGKSAHAAAAPDQGISALEAMIQAFNAINALRPFLPDTSRVHGIITNGGTAANIVPDYCEAVFTIRAETVAALESVKSKVYRAVRAAAEGMGARCEIEEGQVYPERRINKPLAKAFQENLEALGVPVSAPPARMGIGSSDIGRVSQIVPTIQPYFKICDGIVNHTPEFRAAARSEPALQGMNLAAKAIAMTVIDLCYNPNLLAEVRREFLAEG